MKKRFTLWIDDDLLKTIKRIALDEEISLSSLITKCIIGYLKLK